MKLSTKMRYGTRAMVDLALAYPTKALSVKELSQSQYLSIKYLEQIMAALKAGGLVKVVRGVHGGYTLARDPGTIRLIEVFEPLEGALSLVDCVGDPSVCERRDGCVTWEVWSEMTKALEKVLERTTVQDLVERKKQKSNSRMFIYHI